MIRAPLILPLSAAIVSGCTSLGGTIRGDFSCRAARGTCSPLSVNDAGALATLGMEQDRARSFPERRMPDGQAQRSGERVLTVLLPPHVDGDGVFHDAATVHVVAEPPRWSVGQAASSDFAFPRSTAPSLRGIIGDVSASSMEGLGVPPGRAPRPFPTPSAGALDAARAGHRIARPSIADKLPPEAAASEGRQTVVKALPIAPLVSPVTPSPASTARDEGEDQ